MWSCTSNSPVQLFSPATLTPANVQISPNVQTPASPCVQTPASVSIQTPGPAGPCIEIPCNPCPTNACVQTSANPCQTSANPCNQVVAAPASSLTNADAKVVKFHFKVSLH